MKTTYTTVAVARYLLANADREVYGTEIQQALVSQGLRMPPGTLYPILRRLREHGYLTAHWEPPRSAQVENRPPRRPHRLTETGRTALDALVQRWDAR